MQRPFHQLVKERFKLPGFPSHMTSLENLESIVSSGELKCYNLMRGKSYFNLANDDVQAGRARIIVDVTRKPLHDYVPLYFGPKTPMVVRNYNHNNHLLFLKFPLNILQRPEVVFSDGNARDRNTKFYLFQQMDDLNVLNAKAIHSIKWKDEGSEFKRQKQAEILVPDTLPFSEVYDIVCYTKEAREQVLQTLNKYDIKKPVCISVSWYFRISPRKSG